MFFTVDSFAQTPNWQWAKKQAAGGSSQGNSIVTDSAGNVYVAGFFSGTTITFGSTVLTNDTTTGSTDIFVVKYAPNGNVIWAKSYGDVGNDKALAIASDQSGIYVVGYYSGLSIQFGLVSVSDSSAYTGYEDMFVLKLDFSGNPIWAKGAGGMSTETAYGVCSDTSGVYVVGNFHLDRAVFGSTTLIPVSTATMIGFSDPFIVSYDHSGNVKWARSTGGSHFDGAFCATSDSTGVYVGGYLNSSDFFFNGTIYSSNGDSDIFILKYDKNGNEEWLRNYGGANDEYVYAIANDISGIYVTGTFSSPALSMPSVNLINFSSGYDTFISKFTSSGTELWSKRLGGNGNEYPTGILVDTSGIYITGELSGFPVSFGSTTVSCAGGFDAFVAKYNLLGISVWARGVGASFNELGEGIAKHDKDIYVTGHYNSPSINFGSITLTNTLSYQPMMFVAKLDTTYFTIGINEIVNERSLSIHPNPFVNDATLSFSEEQKNVVIRIIDILGKERKTINFSGKQLIIERGVLEDGVYFVQVISKDTGSINRKIIIQ